MTWRKDTTVEIEELRRFVDGMKRGQTISTDDSLLETLRQIHDRDDVPAQSHEHRQLLLDRLQRRFAEHQGESVFQKAPAPLFGLPAPRRKRFDLAVAASILVHVGIGGVVLSTLTFGTDVWNVSEPADRAVVVMLPSISPRVPSPPKSSARVDVPGETPAVADAPLPSGPAPATATAHPDVPDSPSAAEPLTGGLPGDAPAGPAPAAIAVAAGTAPGREPVVDVPPAPSSDDLTMSEVLGVSYVANPDEPARVLNRPRPIYTQQALDNGIHGFVRLSIGVAPDGSVREIKVIRSLGFGLDEAAIAAARQCRFSPAKKAGRAVAAMTKVDVTFELR